MDKQLPPQDTSLAFVEDAISEQDALESTQQAEQASTKEDAACQAT